jgi:flavin-dependent dehydrogenase
VTRQIVVAGGGPAGAAAACLLAQAGRDVLMLERGTAATLKVCGEFLSSEAVAYLGRLGVNVAALGGQPLGRLRLVSRTATVEAALPFRGVGLSRATLDAALLRHATACGAEVQLGTAIGQVRVGSPIAIDIGAAGPVLATTLFLATGKHDLRGVRRKPCFAPDDLVGFKTHLRLSAAQQRALAGNVEVVMFPDGYAGLQPVEGGAANLCLLIERARLLRAGGTWEGLLVDLLRHEPHLAVRLETAVPLSERPASVYRVPYGFVHTPSPDDPARVFRLGDQIGVIASFTGDGMAIALHSAAVAVACFVGGRSAFSYHRQMRYDIAGQIWRASALYRLGRESTGQRLLLYLAATWPVGLVRAGAALTRVPPRSVARAWSHVAAWPSAQGSAA